MAPGRGRAAGAVRSELGRQAGWGGGDGRHRSRVGLCRDALAPVRGWQPLWRADRRGDRREGWRRARIFRRAFSRQQHRSQRGSGRHWASGPRAGLSLLPLPPPFAAARDAHKPETTLPGISSPACPAAVGI